MKDLKARLLPAVIEALKLCILRLFTIPLSIWLGAVERLASISGGQKKNSGSSEFPVLEWIKNAWDGVIVLFWFVGVIAALIVLFKGLFGGFISLLIAFYFGVIMISLFKESLILILSIALNVEKLAADRQPETPME